MSLLSEGGCVGEEKILSIIVATGPVRTLVERRIDSWRVHLHQTNAGDRVHLRSVQVKELVDTLWRTGAQFF